MVLCFQRHSLVTAIGGGDLLVLGRRVTKGPIVSTEAALSARMGGRLAPEHMSVARESSPLFPRIGKRMSLARFRPVQTNNINRSQCCSGESAAPPLTAFLSSTV